MGNTESILCDECIGSRPNSSGEKLIHTTTGVTELINCNDYTITQYDIYSLQRESNIKFTKELQDLIDRNASVNVLLANKGIGSAYRIAYTVEDVKTMKEELISICEQPLYCTVLVINSTISAAIDQVALAILQQMKKKSISDPEDYCDDALEILKEVVKNIQLHKDEKYAYIGPINAKKCNLSFIVVYKPTLKQLNLSLDVIAQLIYAKFEIYFLGDIDVGGLYKLKNNSYINGFGIHEAITNDKFVDHLYSPLINLHFMGFANGDQIARNIIKADNLEFNEQTINMYDKQIFNRNGGNKIKEYIKNYNLLFDQEAIDNQILYSKNQLMIKKPKDLPSTSQYNKEKFSTFDEEAIQNDETDLKDCLYFVNNSAYRCHLTSVDSNVEVNSYSLNNISSVFLLTKVLIDEETSASDIEFYLNESIAYGKARSNSLAIA